MLFLYIHHVLHVLSQLNKNVSQLSHIIQLLVHGQGSQELLLRVSVNAVRASIDISHVRRGHGFRSYNQWCMWYLHIPSLSLALWKVEQICHLLPELSASSSDPPLICSHASTPTLGLQHVTGWSVVNCVRTLTTDELISLTVTI